LCENEEVIHRAKEKKSILHTINRRQANWIGLVLRRNCLLKHIIEENIEGGIKVMEIRGGRRKHLIDDFNERRGYGKLKIKL
jgi:hypothetical protein